MSHSSQREQNKRTMLLIGGGHAHIQVIRDSKLKALQNIHRVLISDSPISTYSGLIPSVIAGLVNEESSSVHLRPLCDAYGFHFIHGTVVHIDTLEKCVYFRPSFLPNNRTGIPLSYDVLSVNVGSVTSIIPSSIEGTDYRKRDNIASVIYTRPISNLERALTTFEEKWKSLHPPTHTPHVLVVGAGDAGMELTFALHTRFMATLGGATLTVASRHSRLGSAYSPRVQALAHAELRLRGIDTIFGLTVTRLEVDKHVASLSNGGKAPFDVAVIATGAAPPRLMKSCDMELDEAGWLLVGSTLQSVSSNSVFGAGDCISFGHRYGTGFPPKAGVYAVRQGPILAHNIHSTLTGTALVAYKPQKSFLSLLATADGCAIGSKYGLAFKGLWVFRLKMDIDERWQAQFRPSVNDNVQESWERDVIFQGSVPEAVAALLGGDDVRVDDNIEVQLSVLKRLDEDEDFRGLFLKQAF